MILSDGRRREQYVPATKRIQFSSLPEVLLVCLNRFSTERKLDTAVGFEEKLDLRPFCRTTRSSIQLASTRCEYTLIGVVMHRGDKNSGHYWAFVRTEADKWFECNDTRVEEAELARVLEEGRGSGRPWKASAYLLLYRRR